MIFKVSLLLSYFNNLRPTKIFLAQSQSKIVMVRLSNTINVSIIGDIIDRSAKLSSYSCLEHSRNYRSVSNNFSTFRKMASWNLKPSKLNLKTPVPSDIRVVRDHTPKKITILASEIGLSEDEYSPYGHHVAKGEEQYCPCS